MFNALRSSFSSSARTRTSGVCRRYASSTRNGEPSPPSSSSSKPTSDTTSSTRTHPSTSPRPSQPKPFLTKPLIYPPTKISPTNSSSSSSSSQPLKIGRKLFLGNIPHTTDVAVRSAQIREAFSRFGKVTQVHLARGKNRTGTFGAVSFAYANEAKLAFTHSQRTPITIENHVLRVEFPKHVPLQRTVRISGAKNAFGSLDEVVDGLRGFGIEKAKFEEPKPKHTLISFHTHTSLTEALEAGTAMVQEGMISSVQIGTANEEQGKFTLEIQGLDLNPDEVKNLFKDFNVRYVSLVPATPTYAYVTFDSEQTARDALGVILSSGWGYVVPKPEKIPKEVL